MARIDINNLDQVMEQFSGGGAGFFALKNDKDCAKVRFLHTDQHSLDIMIVHQAEINGKKRWVSCLSDEEHQCPLCKVGNQQVLKLFLQLEDLRDGKRKIWERGKTFIPTIIGMMNKYGDLNNRVYEIERHGKAGDTKTSYQLYPLDRDGVISDHSREELIGPDKFVLELSYEEMEVLAKGGQPLQVVERTNYNPMANSNPEDVF